MIFFLSFRRSVIFSEIKSKNNKKNWVLEFQSILNKHTQNFLYTKRADCKSIKSTFKQQNDNIHSSSFTLN